MAARSFDIPSHVPKELFWNNSLEEFCHQGDDPFVAAARLHALENPGLLYVRDLGRGVPGWMFTRYSTIEQGFQDWERFSSRRGSSAISRLLGVDWYLIPLEVDPPQHQAYRRIIQPFFSAPAVDRLEEPVREMCHALIGKFERRGWCEFIGEFALQFPSSVFLALVGLPAEMQPQFLDWERDIFRGEPAERVTAARALLHYLEEFVARQRRRPKSDLLKAIFTAEIDGRPLHEDEILGMLYLLYIGGLDTVYSALGFIFRHLALDHSLQVRLRASPGDTQKAVEELLRAFAVAAPSRTVAMDCEWHGVAMKKGDNVLLPTWLAARDPRVYQDPHVIDIDRVSRNLTFASGPHACVGLRLARREIRLVLESFVARFRNIRMIPGEAYEYHTGQFGVDRLMLHWDR